MGARTARRPAGPWILLVWPFAACAFDFSGYDPRGGSGGGVTPCEPGSTRPCYDGPAGSEGIGICRGGVAICRDDGAGHEACLDQVLPATELCATVADEDCDGVSGSDDPCECEPHTEVACFDAAPSRLDVGRCRAGVAVCDADGEGTGPCLGQVTPASESCGSPEDDDCDGAANDHCALWSRRFPDSDHQGLRDLARWPGGHLAIAGWASGPAVWSGQTISAVAPFSVLLASFTSGGDLRWARGAGSAGTQRAEGIAVDPAGDLFVTGHHDSGIDFQGATAALVATGAAPNLFVARLDEATGSGVWALGGSAEGNAIGHDVAFGGALYLVGRFAGDGTLVGQSVTGHGVADDDGFVAGLDADGQPQWLLPFGGAGPDAGLVAAASSDGSAVVAGIVGSAFSFGGSDVQGNGRDILVFEIDASGAVGWVKTFAATGEAQPNAVLVAARGDVFLGGEFEGTLSLGATDLVDDGGSDAFVAKLDGANGEVLWAVDHGDASRQRTQALALASDGTLFASLSLRGRVTVNGLEMIGHGETHDDLAIVALDASDGQSLWGRRFGDVRDQDGFALAIDDDEGLVVGATCTGWVDFGNGTLGPSGTLDAEDVCLAKLSP